MWELVTSADSWSPCLTSWIGTYEVPSSLCSQLLLHRKKLWSQRWSNLALVSRCDLWLLFETLFPSCQIFPPLEFTDYMLFLTTSTLASCSLSHFFFCLYYWNPIFICSVFLKHLDLPVWKNHYILTFLWYFVFTSLSVWVSDVHSYQSLAYTYAPWG